MKRSGAGHAFPQNGQAVMTDEEFDADELGRLRRGVKGVEDRVRIIDTGRTGRIGTPRYRLLPINMAGPAETLSR